LSDPRNKAAHVLSEMHRRRSTTRAVWDGPRTGAETSLVLGVLRRRGTLDAVLAAHATRRLPLLKPETLAALRVGLFELLFQDGAPPHAVVNAAVSYTKDAGRLKDIGFVNAALRAIVRGSRRIPAAEATDARRTLPRGDTAIRFFKIVFPDPVAKPDDFLAARGSAPRWLAARRRAELGPERALACLDLQSSTPPTHVRVAPGRRADVEAALAAAGIAHRPGPLPQLLTLAPDVRASDLFEAAGPWIVVQDCVAARVAPFVAPAEGARVLDYCAAPGGKATHLAQLVGPGGAVTAWDRDPDRLARVAENAERLGLAWLRCGDPDGEYDAVLVDAPCSNTGVLARRPEARWRVRERHLPGMAQRQLKILKQAAAHVRPGGTMVYSTCSLEPEENLGVVSAFLASAPGFLLDAAETACPDEAAGDGGFMARLRRV
jgi:16S rRNA (cytosine967-C5)-methyltransferase